MFSHWCFFVWLVLLVLVVIHHEDVNAWCISPKSSLQQRRRHSLSLLHTTYSTTTTTTNTEDISSGNTNNKSDNYASDDVLSSYTSRTSSLLFWNDQEESNRGATVTLTRYLEGMVKENPDLTDLQSLLLGIQMACKTISNLVNRAGLVYSKNVVIQPPQQTTTTAATTTTTPKNNTRTRHTSTAEFSDGRFYSMKRLDQLSTIVLKNALKYSGNCQVVTPVATHPTDQPAEHQPGVLLAKLLTTERDQHHKYVACLDPLDGSGNADASICTGTVFGVFEQQEDDENDNDNDKNKNKDDDDDYDDLVNAVLQPAKNMRAAGYCLYSSATVLVFTLGNHTVQGFTLDPQLHEFVLTHPNLTIPARGNVYSCNEGNSLDGWSVEFQTYLEKLKTGQGQTLQKYAHRYVGSMVGDIHRTIMYGGIFAYPADQKQHPAGNLQLLYKTAPMAFVVHHAGGHAINQQGENLLNIRPRRIHEKSPCFMGSPRDVEECQSYLIQEKEKKES